MKKILMAAAAAMMAGSAGAAVIFQDNFNRADSTTLGSPQIGNAWSESVSAGDGGALISGNNLVLTNDETAAANANGRVWAYTSLAGLTGYNTTLSSNSNVVEWSFNMQQVRTNPAGFDAGNYGVAFVLAGSSSDFMDGTGYAIVLGNSVTPDPLRLARYNGGLDANANISNIISSGDYGNTHFNIRVTYNPTGDLWSLYATTGASFGDPSAVATQLGSTTADNTYTSSSLANMGALWSYSTGAAQSAKFDNVTLTVIPEPGTLSILGAFGFAMAMRMRRRKI